MHNIVPAHAAQILKGMLNKEAVTRMCSKIVLFFVLPAATLKAA